MDKRKFGDALYKAINDSKYSYDYIAKELNLKSSREIYNYVNGIKLPSTSRFIKLVQLLNMDISKI